jgi:phage terminase small subunit
MGALTLKQQAFCEAYLASGNGTRSAIAAGYSAKTAYVTSSKNLKNANIRQYLNSRLTERQDKAIASSNEILEYLTKLMRGQIPGVYTSQKIQAAELLGKYYGLWEGKGATQTDVKIKVVWED